MAALVLALRLFTGMAFVVQPALFSEYNVSTKYALQTANGNDIHGMVSRL